MHDTMTGKVFIPILTTKHLKNYPVSYAINQILFLVIFDLLRVPNKQFMKKR